MAHTIASLSDQCRQVYCLVEMAPSAPSRPPPRHGGEFDGFPGWRERPNQCCHTTIVSGLSTYPTLRRGRRRRMHHQIHPETSQVDNLLQRVPKGQTRAEYSSTSTTASTGNPKNDRTTELISHRLWNPESKLCRKIMNWIAPNLSFQNPKQEMSWLVLILQQIKQKHSTLKFLREKSS